MTKAAMIVEWCLSRKLRGPRLCFPTIPDDIKEIRKRCEAPGYVPTEWEWVRCGTFVNSYRAGTFILHD